MKRTIYNIMYAMVAMILATACDDKNDINYERAPLQPTARWQCISMTATPRSLSSNPERLRI